MSTETFVLYFALIEGAGTNQPVEAMLLLKQAPRPQETIVGTWQKVIDPAKQTFGPIDFQDLRTEASIVSGWLDGSNLWTHGPRSSNPPPFPRGVLISFLNSWSASSFDDQQITITVQFRIDHGAVLYPLAVTDRSDTVVNECMAIFDTDDVFSAVFIIKAWNVNFGNIFHVTVGSDANDDRKEVGKQV
jgi:hypothetical protein